jgi:drug/metabolite transporter (DMT)-like permease
VTTGLQSLVLLPLAWWLEPAPHAVEAWWRFAAVSLAVAALASIVGNALWNRMSRLLPLTLVGQMILFETLFALLYGFAWAQRWPTGLEWAALVCVVAGVLMCLKAHRTPAATH